MKARGPRSEIERIQTAQSAVQDERTPQTCPQNFFRSYVPTQAKNTAYGLAIRIKERMYTLDSGASSHMMGLLSSNNNEENTLRQLKQNPGCSDRQWHCGLRPASKGLHQGAQRLSLGTFWWKIHHQCCPWEVCAMSMVILIRGRQEKLPDYQKVRKWSNAASKTSSPWYQLPNKKLYHPLDPRQPKENLEREKEVAGTMLDLSTPCTKGLEEYDASGSEPVQVVKEKPLDDKLPSVVIDAGRDTLAKATVSKKGIIGSQPRGNHNVFTLHPKDPSCEVCRKTNQHEPGVE